VLDTEAADANISHDLIQPRIGLLSESIVTNGSMPIIAKTGIRQSYPQLIPSMIPRIRI